MASLGRKRPSWGAKEADGCCFVATKGHCVVYSGDGKQFEVPLAYLTKTVFTQLLQMSHEEFGFTSDGRITIPCDAAAMEYVMCLLRRSASADIERAFLSTMAMPCHYAYCGAPSAQPVAVCSS